MDIRACRIAATLCVVLSAPRAFGAPPEVQGSFVVGGVEAKLSHARATRVELEKGKRGFALLLSASEAEGDIRAWQTADPKERGSFLFLLLEPNGAVWVAEIGHAASKAGRFGVVTEVLVEGFAAESALLKARVRTVGEQEFSDDRYRIDLQVAAPLGE
jgi:hypothetical protein